MRIRRKQYVAHKPHGFCVCSGKTKRAFETRDEALVARNKRRLRLRVYECPQGNGWHLTSQLEKRTH